jgi:hypothetical protein
MASSAAARSVQDVGSSVRQSVRPLFDPSMTGHQVRDWRVDGRYRCSNLNHVETLDQYFSSCSTAIRRPSTEGSTASSRFGAEGTNPPSPPF